MPERAAEPRIEVIEGQRTLVAPTMSGLPRTLDRLLDHMYAVTFRADIRPRGARSSCTQARQHRFERFREGRWFAIAGLRRGEVLDLALRMCADCGAVEVRDVSYDVLRGQARPASGPPKRRDHVLDWYTGANPRQRQAM